MHSVRRAIADEAAYDRSYLILSRMTSISYLYTNLLHLLRTRRLKNLRSGSKIIFSVFLSQDALAKCFVAPISASAILRPAYLRYCKLTVRETVVRLTPKLLLTCSPHFCTLPFEVVQGNSQFI
jgi:hypothetical protein